MIESKPAILSKSLLTAVLAAIVMVLLICGTPKAEPVSTHVVSQGEFASYLVSELGWKSGVPEEPKISDYLAVLSGKHSFRFEAEDFFNIEGDSVTVRNYPLYGPFSGSGWLSGTAAPTTVRFTVFLPRGGEYLLSVVSKGDGQHWYAGGKDFTVNTGGSLREKEAGTITLNGGKQEISVMLPPEGGVDALILNAVGDFPAIEPLGGWRPDTPLSWGDYAETMATVLNLEKNFPAVQAAKPEIVAFKSIKKLPPAVSETNINYLGAHTAASWVRAGANGAVLELPIDVAANGIYALRVRLLGSTFITDFNGVRKQWDGKPYLYWYDLGVARLSRGTHVFKIELPPLGGADVVELTAHKSSQQDYLAALGLVGKNPSSTLSRAELEDQLRKDLGRLIPAR
ncbi:hypothetical protein [Geobacter benzoatilyticus]|uniref:Uncharacterized protein n=1 Tax=Geobacter benzoatilyticus TaxID=2815309 RepID=A0ABX7Q163_9BACT|nr:hypothetical protein [Geobacter benzoatilyticus]QSV45144.1 hypothetical protein JZM60_13500 [Geobacter benzoatilyticus]